ncbi:aldo/keto reductase [Actinomadura flavalba]|uniref:aldo/keto reductase n=1 Tax=Actinomadura flavalba TaxID=1120938 RepID=UPI000399FFB9|nr:aldo/keto reductase [Actinomadura flavalba]
MQLPGPGAWGPPKDRGEAVAVLRQAVERGVDHVDTAGFYGPHVANDLICEALHPYADGLVIATKVGVERDGLGAWNPSASPRSLREQVEDNLAACTCPSWTWSTCGSAVTACCRRTRRRGRSRSRR